jgi:hypothetical protein
MIAEMANVAIECVTHPKKASVWVPELDRYVCPNLERGQGAPAETRGGTASHGTAARAEGRPPIDPQFKLVFLTAASGTLLFIILCVALTSFRGSDMPPLLDKLVTGIFDLAKIGFGAVVGPLGGKVLQGS